VTFGCLDSFVLRYLDGGSCHLLVGLVVLHLVDRGCYVANRTRLRKSMKACSYQGSKVPTLCSSSRPHPSLETRSKPNQEFSSQNTLLHHTSSPPTHTHRIIFYSDAAPPFA